MKLPDGSKKTGGELHGNSVHVDNDKEGVVESAILAPSSPQKHWCQWYCLRHYLNTDSAPALARNS